MTEYALDLYPRDDPKDGTRLVRYTFEDLIAAEYRDVIGVGSGSAIIWVDHAGAEHIDSRGEQYVRVVRLGGTEKVVGGIWTSKLPFETAIASERRHLTISGPGQMAYLARAVMAPHTYVYDIFNGQDPFDGIFRLSAQSTIFAGGPFLGAMLWRVIYEAQHFRVGTTPYSHIHAGEDDFGELVVDIHDDDRTVSRIPEVTMGFDQFTDSNGNAWTLTAGEFIAQVGENVLGVVQRLMQAGLFIWMDPDTFTLHAWEGRPATRLGRSTNRTGASWGANVVRFQSPTDGTIATGSILSDANRVVNSYLPRGPIWVGGNDIYVKNAGATDALAEGFVHSTAEDTAALTIIGQTQSNAREEAADVGQLKTKLGSDPTNGYYLPGEHYLLDELVRVNTGTGEFDYDEADYPVGAWRVSLAPDGAEWLAFAELGASYDEAQRREFAIPSTPGHTHPPNPELCRPGSISGFEPLQLLGVACSNSGANFASDHPAWAGDNEERVEITAAVATAVGDTIIVEVVNNLASSSHDSNPQTVYDQQGNAYTRDAQHTNTSSSAKDRIEFWRCNVTTALAAGDYIRWAVNLGTSLSPAEEIGGRCIGAYLYSGTADSPSVGTGASAISNTPSITTPAGDLVVAGASIGGQSTDVLTEDADWDDMIPNTHVGGGGSSRKRIFGQQLIAAGADTWTLGISPGRDWAAIAVGYTTSGSSGSVGDGHRDLVGSSPRAARCDHRHDVHRARAPLPTDDWATQGYKLGTIWAQLDDLANPTEIVGTWMLVDITEGAAVWLRMDGSDGTDHTHAGAAGLPWFIVTDYGAVGDGTTNDTAAINSAIAALNSAGRGVLYFPAGRYLCASALTAITVPCSIVGDGMGDIFGVDAATEILCSSGTVALMTIAQHAVTIRDLALINTAGSEPTAGGGIVVTTGDLTHIERVSVKGFFIDIDFQDGAGWTVDNSYILAPAEYGIKARHIDLVDGGDWAISNCWFYSDDYDAVAAIRYESGGGGKITNCKFNALFSFTHQFDHMINLAMSGGVSTSVLLIEGNSIENFNQNGITATTVSGSDHGRIIINGNQFGQYVSGAGKAISMVAGTLGELYQVIISNNLFNTETGSARSAIQLTRCDYVTLVGNGIENNFTSLYTNTSSTNVVEIGGGVTDHGALTGLADDDHTQYLNNARHAALAHSGVGGEILISDTPAGTPLVFADLLQNEAQDDLLYEG